MVNVTSEGSRERLLKAASALFFKKGYEATSVKDLARSAGLNVSLVSYHFGGKKNLYQAVLEQFGRDRLSSAERLLQPPGTLEELRLRLSLFAEEVWNCHESQREVCQMIHREAERGFPAAEEIFKSTFLRAFQAIVEFFKAAQDRGLIREDASPLLIAGFFHTNVLAIAKSDPISEKYFKKTIRDPRHRSRVLEHILASVLEGFAGSHRERTS